MGRWTNIKTSYQLLEELIQEETDECILWPMSLRSKGYGQVYDPRQKRQKGAHILAWEIVHGRELDVLFCIMHTCDVPGCVNPRHLKRGTLAENNQDMFAKGRGVNPPINPRDPNTGRWTKA